MIEAHRIDGEVAVTRGPWLVAWAAGAALLAGCEVEGGPSDAEPGDDIPMEELSDGGADDAGDGASPADDPAGTDDQDPDREPDAGSAAPGWDPSFRIVEIPAVDGSLQPSIFRASRTPGRPLVVVLHTWSADFLQESYSLREQALELDWNYIHPDFRGRNDHPEACCSSLALDDIDRAIEYAMQRTDAAPDRVHVVGVSGGAYATLCAFASFTRTVASYMAWNGITDLAAWRDESLALSQPRHAMDVEDCVDAPPEQFAAAAALRSPQHMAIPDSRLHAKAESQLLLYAGIDDGREGIGTVPPTHTLRFYNRIVRARDGDRSPALVTDEEIDRMIGEPDSLRPSGSKLAERDVLFERRLRDGSVAVAVFDGAHEWLEPVLVARIEAGR